MGEKVISSKSEWLCINCGKVLGRVLGGELFPVIDGQHMRTSGPNLTVTCPECGQIKTWYTSDSVVRAVYQLVNAISETAARSMVEQMGRAVNQLTKTE